MFWVRGGAMSALWRHEWSDDGFKPCQKGKEDGSSGSALLRMYPMIAQESGFFSGCVCPSALAGFQYANIYSNLQKRSALKINPDSVHFSDVKKIIGLYLKRKLHRKRFG